MTASDSILNFRRLEAFLAVVDTGSISRAAELTEVAQSVVSRHVAALEKQLGCSLFERSNRGITLTPVAARLAPRLRGAIDEMQRASYEAAEIGNEPSGVVRVGVVPSAAHPLVGLLFQRMAAQYPRISLQYVEGFTNPLEEMLADGRIDLAVVNRIGRKVRRGDERLCSFDTMVFGAPEAFESGQEVSFVQLAKRPLVLPARPNALRAALDIPSKKYGLQLHVFVESDSLLIMKDLVLHAGLFTVLPKQAMHEELRSGRLSAARLVNPTMLRTLNLLSSVKRPSSAATRTVARELRGIVQRDLIGKAWG